jgi:hypothetical protein
VLAVSGRTVLVHSDLQGNNHLWDPDTLRLQLIIARRTVFRLTFKGVAGHSVQYVPARSVADQHCVLEIPVPNCIALAL